MEVQKKYRKTQNINFLSQLISQHSDLSLYFSQHAVPQKYDILAVSLMRQAIVMRANQKKPQKHYNVAYVKHNRFLSPSQKQAVSPKVTETIPVSPQPVKIYGKPKVKLDDQFINNEEQSVASKIQTITAVGSQTDLHRLSNEHIIEKKCDPDIQSEKYLSPRNPTKVWPKQIQQAKQQPKKGNMQETGKISGKGELKLDSNYYNNKQSKNYLQSPKGNGLKQTYNNVQSRIKFLVERDKKNSRIRQQLQDQNRKIDQLQNRQEKLLMKQYQQTKDLNRVASKPQLSCCCVSSDQEITKQLLKMRKQNVKANYQSTLSNIKERLSSGNSHKITANNLYPLSSSSDSDSSEEVLVAALY